MKIAEKNALDWIALVLVIVGGLNWGLVVFDANVVAPLGPTVANVVYGLVGLSALYMIYYLTRE